MGNKSLDYNEIFSPATLLIILGLLWLLFGEGVDIEGFGFLNSLLSGNGLVLLILVYLLFCCDE
ncbi:MAG: hypothetical protein FWG10_08575 [Eubacteriaceae bacterium]|nr:hypothetical protein [Eubacteriaceae bacterium]